MEPSYKIALIGTEGVGRRTLIYAAFDPHHNLESDDPYRSLPQDYKRKFEVDGSTIFLEVWDGTGREPELLGYHLPKSKTTQNYRITDPALLEKNVEIFRKKTLEWNSAAAVLVFVYDISSAESFKFLHDQIDLFINASKDIKLIVICGNKCDLTSTRRVEAKEGQDLAEAHEGLFFEVSASTGINVDPLFEEIARKLARDLPRSEPDSPAKKENKKNDKCLLS